MPYCFLGSSIKLQGHAGWKIDDLNPIWVRLLGRSQLSNPTDLPCLFCFCLFLVCFLLGGCYVVKLFCFSNASLHLYKYTPFYVVEFRTAVCTHRIRCHLHSKQMEYYHANSIVHEYDMLEHSQFVHKVNRCSDRVINAFTTVCSGMWSIPINHNLEYYGTCIY